MAGLDPDLSSYGGYANTNKLLATAGNTADNANGWLTAARQQTALQSGQQQLSAQRLAAVNQIAGAVLADPTPENAVSSITQGIRMGVIPADEGAKELATVASFGGDTGKIKQYAFDHVQRIATVQQQMEAGGMAAPSYQNVGNKLIGVQSQSGLHPQMNVVGGAQPTMQPTPEFQNSKTDYTDQSGVKRQTTNAGFSAAVASNGGAIAGPTPGTEEAARVTQQAGAEQGVALQKTADGAPTRKGMLDNLSDDLDHFTSGPGADWQQVGKAWANRNVLPTSMQFDPQSIASQESFTKQATQLAQQQFTSLGGTGTDSQLSSSFKANPNQALSQLGNKQIIQLLKGNEDAIQAKARAWTDWSQAHGSGTYAQFQQDFNKTYNPRVYQAMYMDPQQIADMRKNMSPAQQKQFAQDYIALKNKGYITPGGAGGQ